MHKRRYRQIAVFAGVPLVCAFLVLLGAYAEARWILWTNFRSLTLTLMYERRLSPPEVYAAKGDPGLVQWVQKQQLSLPRPDLTNAEGLHTWQTRLRNTLLATFDLPDISSSVDVYYHKKSSTAVAQDIVRTFLTFESFDGTEIPAYLFVPPLSGPQPAIIVLHGHVKYGEGISQTGGIVRSYQHGVALELAKAGYITLTMEFRGFGYLGARINTEHRMVAYNAIAAGSFYKAILSKDIKYALDLLQSLEEIDPQRIGITGVSFGGEMATTYAALDERVKVVVFQGFGGRLGEQRGVVGKSQKDQPHYCHIIPGHNKYLYREDLFLLIAPRPLLGVRGSQEYSEDSQFAEVIGKAYGSLDALSAFRFEVLPGGHEYFIQPAIQFFRQHL